MAKTKFQVPLAPTKSSAPWQASHLTYLAGRSHLDGVDALAIDMERKWGVDRLRLLVTPELREKFDRQRVLLNQATRNGAVADVEREARRMVIAWQTLDRVAQEAGKAPLEPRVWEVALPGGGIAAIVRDATDAHAVVAEGRAVQVWTLDEVARVIHGFPAIAKAKIAWPGATVTAVRTTVPDPLQDFDDDLEMFGSLAEVA